MRSQFPRDQNCSKEKKRKRQLRGAIKVPPWSSSWMVAAYTKTTSTTILHPHNTITSNSDRLTRLQRNCDFKNNGTPRLSSLSNSSLPARKSGYFISCFLHQPTPRPVMSKRHSKVLSVSRRVDAIKLDARK